MARIFFNKNVNAVLLFAAIIISFSSCRQLDVYEKNVSIPGYQWKSSFVPAFDFEINDTASLYSIFLVLRHTDAYRYNNIWLNIAGTQGKDTLLKIQHIEMVLGNDAKGWEGTGMDDIWEVRKPVGNGPVQFRKKGRYHFTVAQAMREEPLANVMSVGLRVERVK